MNSMYCFFYSVTRKKRFITKQGFFIARNGTSRWYLNTQCDNIQCVALAHTCERGSGAGSFYGQPVTRGGEDNAGEGCLHTRLLSSTPAIDQYRLLFL